ncbi:MAG TPA: hypothetical protein VEU28_07655, partial [Actinomycetota bacterium]|nr:hypothetical protein [Actinomycetota bacterium]
MLQSIDEVLSSLQAFVEGFDPKSLSREQSKELFDKFVLVERLGAAGKTLTSLQAAETNVWWDGPRSPAHYVAHKSKCPVGRAVDLLDTAELMRRLPETEKAFRKGA